MITTAYARRMARYNRWQNESIYTAASSLSETDRRRDRGSFFQSIHKTLSHILWADRLWMSRLSDWSGPGVGIPDSPDLYPDWEGLKAARKETDARFISWADTLSDVDVRGELTYANTSGVVSTRNRAVCIMQVFNHQTHHRGQVHAMLTAAGAAPGDTDIPFMPEAYF